MKCSVCDGSGVVTCFYCCGEGECIYCEGKGKGQCPICGGVGEKPRPHPDSYSIRDWAEVPEPIRKDVEQHVAANLPADVLEKLYDLHARGMAISDDDTFFHFGGGLAVRNLCRQRLKDDELAAACGDFRANWDSCYIGVLAAIAARRQ